jgi:hypothetical protein
LEVERLAHLEYLVETVLASELELQMEGEKERKE